MATLRDAHHKHLPFRMTVLFRNGVYILAVVFCILVGLLASSGRLYACSVALTCTPPVRLFGENAQVPGNLIYFKVLEDNPGMLILRKSDGTPIAASIRQIGA
jgi:hypothetical protein